jgi:hypothetical protein
MDLPPWKFFGDARKNSVRKVFWKSQVGVVAD